jgi:hypothetical protein
MGSPRVGTCRIGDYLAAWSCVSNSCGLDRQRRKCPRFRYAQVDPARVSNVHFAGIEQGTNMLEVSRSGQPLYCNVVQSTGDCTESGRQSHTALD